MQTIIVVLIVALFSASGVAALLYQFVWIRLLTHLLGGTSLAISTVLAVFFAAGAAPVDEALSRPGRGALRLAFAGGLAATLGSFFLAYAA